MIFKFQLAVITAHTVLVYNEDQSIMGEFPATKDIVKRMKGRPKVFFDCDYINTKVLINREVPDPGW